MSPQINFRIALLLTLLLAVGAGAAPQKGHTNVKNVVCSECHTCKSPTASNPCLAACPRPHSSEKDLSQGPDIVTLGALEADYEPVLFEHRRHAEMSAMGKECSNCHHYSAGGRIGACRECHPKAAAEHIEQPGLKGAYHRQCMGCHEEWNGANDCEVCHAKKGSPAAIAHANGNGGTRPAGLPALTPPEKKVWSSSYGGGTKVTFFHSHHVDRYGIECSVCHHTESCSGCHSRNTTTTTMRHSEEALHGICNSCHSEMSCQQCHMKSEAAEFSHDRTGWPLSKHHRNLACRSCHGSNDHFNKPVPQCSSCHSDFALGKFQHKRTGLALNEQHAEIECAECHTNGNFAASPKCESCHGTDFAYPAKVPGSLVR